VTYSSLAPIYDRIMAHVDYGDWVGLIERILRRYSTVSNPSLLEIGGGTGMLAQHLRRAGYSCLTSDLSFAMCREARARGGIPFCADGRALPVSSTFDLISFLYDGINYLMSEADYAALFREVHRCLETGGLFLFDITTRANSLRYFRDWLSYEDFGDQAYVRHSYFDDTTSEQHNDFTIFQRSQRNPSLFVKTRERHVQWVVSPREIRRWVPKQLYDVLGVWDGYSFGRWSRHSERIHVLLRSRAEP
jgi:SAM-dependent methyltransferase